MVEAHWGVEDVLEHLPVDVRSCLSCGDRSDDGSGKDVQGQDQSGDAQEHQPLVLQRRLILGNGVGAIVIIVLIHPSYSTSKYQFET